MKSRVCYVDPLNTPTQNESIYFDTFNDLYCIITDNN